MDSYPADNTATLWLPRAPPSWDVGGLQASRTPPTLCPTSDSTMATVLCKHLKYYFCSLYKQPRKRCLVKDTVSSSCGKRGHYEKVRKSKSPSKPSSITCMPWEYHLGRRHLLNPAALHAGHGCCHLRHRHLKIKYSNTPPYLQSMTVVQHWPPSRWIKVTLTRSMMDTEVNGHKMSCLFDRGSTESFIHPNMVQRFSLAIR
ncbi:uncharacterized protein [Narcine bancroftii]